MPPRKKAAAADTEHATSTQQEPKQATSENPENQSLGDPEKQSQLATILIGLLIIASGLLIYNYFQNANQPATTVTRPTGQASNVTPSLSAAVSTPTPSPTSTPKATTTPQPTIELTATPTPKNNTPSPTPSPTAPTQGSYTAVVGDSLWSVAQKVYGSGYDWTKIAAANDLPKDSSGQPILEVGQVLTVPNSAASTSAQGGVGQQPQVAPGLTQTPATAITTYIVQHGDSLWQIAQQLYGNGAMWTLIYNDPHNRLSTLPGGQPLIHAGNELYIPQNPAGP